MKDQTVESLMQKLDEATTLINKLRRSAKHYQRECYTWRQCAQKAEAELAKPKGDAVPVAYLYQYAGCETCEGFRDWREELSRERPPEWMIKTGKVTGLVELFTHAQPVPVVVLPPAPTGHDCPEHIQDPFSWACGAEWMLMRVQDSLKSADGEGEL
ncbi:hypothetical protein BS639_17040 [Rouxiella silvae]|uniref:Uncharacterized protein n=1 Tax=Rouxiella silvae TaxID=1646373 RepID=A0ABX3TXM2_9GAMM|nr:hypothetical protein [Rouxiella silvae]ORJ20000.1 hypothetical protein BS639_17040 [Rouxiella silvae]